MADDNSLPTPSSAPSTPAPARWRPIGAIDRRVLGVLAEKAKTTPDAYPMSLNAITTGCNQKSNRAPLMQLEVDDVQESLDRLREMGTVGMIEGYGRVTKYRHYLYEWLGVDKLELSVMTELLLRGPQTEGELRGRASRMDPIPDLSALRELLNGLKSKGLVLALTPEGRGHTATHALYAPKELEQLKVQYGAAGAAPFHPPESGPPPARQPAAAPGDVPPAPPAPRSPSSPAALAPPAAGSLERQLNDLRAQLAELRGTVEELAAQQQAMADEIRLLKDALGG